MMPAKKVTKEFQADDAWMTHIEGALTEKRLREFSADIDMRSAFFNRIWGTIRWNKELGRPASSTMHEAFIIEHWYQHPQQQPPYPQPPVPPTKWDQDFDVTSWDYSRDDLEVRFTCSVRPAFRNLVAVRLAEPRLWQDPHPTRGPGFHVIEPPSQNVAGTVDLAVFDFRVVMHPFIPRGVATA